MLELLMYADVKNEMFPLARRAAKGRPVIPQARSKVICNTFIYGWKPYILPFIEEQATYDAIEFDRSPFHVNNRTTPGKSIDAFLCPARQAFLVTLQRPTRTYWVDRFKVQLRERK